MALTPDERDELRAAARSLLARDDVDAWAKALELGWTSIHVDEGHGGGGCGYADLAVVLHELGRALTPSPFLASAVLATGALSLASDDAVAGPAVAALVDGSAIGSVAFASTSGSYDLRQLSTTWRADGDAIRLGGTAGFVLDADRADVLVVAARDEAGTVAAAVIDTAAPGVRVEPVPTVDETRHLFTVQLDGVTTDRLLCEPGEPAEALFDGVLALGVVAAAIDATGAAERGLEVTTEYAKQRVQFGKPIGTFQAVKHHCANMAIAVDASRAASRAAAAALDGDRSGWAHAAAVAASYVGPACSDACALELRVHGGIGFTWEHGTHRRLERVKLDEVLFGTPAWHRRRLADAVFPDIVASAIASRSHR